MGVEVPGMLGKGVIRLLLVCFPLDVEVRGMLGKGVFWRLLLCFPAYTEVSFIRGIGEENDGDLENDEFVFFFAFIFFVDVDEKFSMGDNTFLFTSLL